MGLNQCFSFVFFIFLLMGLFASPSFASTFISGTSFQFQNPYFLFMLQRSMLFIAFCLFLLIWMQMVFLNLMLLLAGIYFRLRKVAFFATFFLRFICSLLVKFWFGFSRLWSPLCFLLWSKWFKWWLHILLISDACQWVFHCWFVHLRCEMLCLLSWRLRVLAKEARNSIPEFDRLYLSALDGVLMAMYCLSLSAACPVNFEFLNYTIITSQCKGPQYTPSRCCGSFKEFACPYADVINDLTNDCASIMFSYINLYGKYPPGLFANECKEGKLGLACPAPAPSELAADKNGSQIMRGPILLLMFLAGFLVVFFQLLWRPQKCFLPFFFSPIISF